MLSVLSTPCTKPTACHAATSPAVRRATCAAQHSTGVRVWCDVVGRGLSGSARGLASRAEGVCCKCFEGGAGDPHDPAPCRAASINQERECTPAISYHLEVHDGRGGAPLWDPAGWAHRHRQHPFCSINGLATAAVNH